MKRRKIVQRKEDTSINRYIDDEKNRERKDRRQVREIGPMGRRKGEKVVREEKQGEK